MQRTAMYLCAVLLVSLMLIATESVAANDATYYACQSCHEQDGSGNEAVGAPAIAGMDAEYVATQMRKFRDGVRGASIDDLPGRQMNLVAAILTDDAEIDAVAAYVAAMARVDAEPTIEVSVDKGEELFAACAACHGVRGSGNKALAAPAIAGLNDWYIQSQLTRFRDGHRGNQPGDQTGALMRAAAGGLSDDAIRVLSAYVAAMDIE